jgi:cytochrome c oxidase subunit 2
MTVPAAVQSALEPHGPRAAEIAEIGWVLFAGAAIIFVGVMALAAWAGFGGRKAWLSREGFIVGAGIVFPAVVLFILLLYTLFAAARITASETPALRIEVTGKQWWWEVRYLTGEGELDFVTANELRIPAGQTVEVLLRSADVLHSFWVPNLAGKLDMVPGMDNRLRLAAERPGTFRGQCAEYCGGPHALMAFYVVAMGPQQFDAWRAGQRQSASPEESEGKKLFLARCAACHTVRGTPARGELGPDLTHVGSRLSLAAGILPNNAGAIAGWIVEGQRIKPGNLMPAFGHFSSEELTALARYVEGLQ